MKLFSERKAIEPPKVVQSNDMDQPLRNKLWSVFYDHFFRHWPNLLEGFPGVSEFVRAQPRWLWVNLLNHTSDSYPGNAECVHALRQVFVGGRWDKVYSAVEVCLTRIPASRYPKLIPAANAVLEQENAGYRILAGKVTDIISPQEIHEVDQTASAAPPPVRTHLDAAVRYLSIAEKRDYRNSIKESISAVESLCRLAGGVSLEEGLRQLKKKIKVHPALEQAFINFMAIQVTEVVCDTH